MGDATCVVLSTLMSASMWSRSAETSPPGFQAGWRSQAQGEFTFLCTRCNSFPDAKWPNHGGASAQLIHLGAKHHVGLMKGSNNQDFGMVSAPADTWSALVASRPSRSAVLPRRAAAAAAAVIIIAAAAAAAVIIIIIIIIIAAAAAVIIIAAAAAAAAAVIIIIAAAAAATAVVVIIAAAATATDRRGLRRRHTVEDASLDARCRRSDGGQEPRVPREG